MCTRPPWILGKLVKISEIEPVPIIGKKGLICFENIEDELKLTEKEFPRFLVSLIVYRISLNQYYFWILLQVQLGHEPLPVIVNNTIVSYREPKL